MFLRYCVFFIGISLLTACDKNELFSPCEEKEWFRDLDGDGLGDPDNSIFSCFEPIGFVSNSDDLDDQDGSNNSNEEEEESQLILDFETYFFNHQWINTKNTYIPIGDTYYAVVFGVSESNYIAEGFDMEVGVKYESSLSYENENGKIILNSSVLDNLLRYLEPPFSVVSINQDVLELEDSTGEVKIFQNRSSIDNCVIERILNAEWLIYRSNSIGDDDCIRFDSIKLLNQGSILGEPMNLYGIISTPEFPTGVTPSLNFGSNTIIAINGCDNLYSTFPDEIYDNDCGSHIFEFDDAQVIGNRFICAGYEFDIID